MVNKKKSVLNLTLAAMFMAIGMVLPFLTGQIRQMGNMFLPMHIPVLMCGLVCGWQYGMLIGLGLPFLRYVLFGMPVLFPVGISMAFELATYGAVIGLLYSHSRWQCVIALYRSLLLAMLSGRIVWAVVQMVLLGVGGDGFTWKMFVSGAFVNAIPGIVLQLVLIPVLMVAIHRTGLVHFGGKTMAEGRE